MPSIFHNPQKQQGFTLVEVLVAVLILSFGMLGLTGVQAFALQSNREAKLYTEGTNLARELAEMMRGNNLVAVKKSATDNPYLLDSQDASLPKETCLRVGTSCGSTTEVAAAQMTEWYDRVISTLPGARVSVCFDSEPYDEDGLPQWDCTAGTTNVDEVIMLKIGWTLRSTDSSASDGNANLHASSNQSRPQIVLPVTGGNPFDLNAKATIPLPPSP